MKRSMNCYIDLGMNCDHGRPSHTTLVYPAAVSAKDSHGSLLSSSRGLLGEGRLRSFPKRHSLKCLRLCAEYQLCTFYRVVHVNVIESIVEDNSSLCTLTWNPETALFKNEKHLLRFTICLDSIPYWFSNLMICKCILWISKERRHCHTSNPNLTESIV